MSRGWRVEVFDMDGRQWMILHGPPGSGHAVFKTRKEAEDIALKASRDQNTSSINLLDSNGKRHVYKSVGWA